MSTEDLIRSAVARAVVRLQDDVSRELTTLADELPAVCAPSITADVAKANAPGDVPITERLLNGVRAISGARTLTETLDALVGAAGREALRVGVFLVRGDRLVGWRLLGFEVNTPGQPVLTIAASGMMSEAVAARTVAVGQPPAFANVPAAARALAIPLMVGGEVVALLYGDQASVAEAGHGWLHAMEVLGRHASRTLEAITAMSAARYFAEMRPDAIVHPATLADDEHAAAQRYARLLVSEIKLYHEAAVGAARRERDLLARLGGEIARARSLYDERVAPAVRRETDYFHDEIVRTLADGDAGVLGTATLGAEELA